MMSSLQRYSVVWQQCGPDSNIAKRFYVPGFEGYLPFFVWGSQLELLESKRQVPLTEENLLKGILFGLWEHGRVSAPWHRSQDKKTLLYLLDVLGNGFGFENPESMILRVSADVREKNGPPASRIILNVGNQLVPGSSKIKSDLVCDIWSASRGGEQNSDHKEVLELVSSIEFSDIMPQAREIVSYYGLCSLVLLKDSAAIPFYLDKYVYTNVSSPELKIRIKGLLTQPENYGEDDLRIL